jgi:hypothetical protein
MKTFTRGTVWIIIGCLFFPPLILVVLAVWIAKSIV